MKRRELLLAAPALLLGSRALAMPLPFPVLFGGKPRWAIDMDLATDYTIGRDYQSVRGMFPLGVDTHSGEINSLAPSGIYQSFPANTPVRTGLGLQTVPTRTNSEFHSINDYENAYWEKATGLVEVEDFAPDPPNNTNCLSKLSELAGTGSHHIHASTGRLTPVVSTVYTMSWVVNPTGGDRYVQLTFWLAGFGATAYCNFDLYDRVYSAAAGISRAAITQLGNGDLLIEASAAATATGASGCQLAFVSGLGAAWAESYTVAPGSEEHLWIGNCQIEAGAFASPPIYTTSAAVTVNGNQQVISGLGTQLAVGVAGIVQINALQAGASGVRALSINDGTGSNRLEITWDASAVNLICTTGGVSQAVVSLPTSTPSTGVITIAFAGTGNYVTGRIVGQSAASVDTTITWPVVDRLALAGVGNTVASNMYAFTRKLALKFGPQDASTFAAMYDRAVLAAAA
jgi:hypothetical protein